MVEQPSYMVKVIRTYFNCGHPSYMVKVIRTYFNCGHPGVFLLEYSRVRLVKTQLIYCQITSMTTCFDSRIIIRSILHYGNPVHLVFQKIGDKPCRNKPAEFFSSEQWNTRSQWSARHNAWPSLQI